MERDLGIRILHYTKPDKPDRTRWTDVIQYMLQDPRVSVFHDKSGTPYTGLNNLYDDIAKRDPQPTHLLVLHHDILPCFNFISTVERVLDLLPNEPITFYSNSRAIDTALKEGGHWVKLKPWYYSQAFVMPFPLMREMISWINENVGVDYRMSDDERMAMYFYYHGRYVYATAPSLVEHIGWNSTTVDYDRPMANYLDDKNHRMARRFIGIDRDPLEIDWTKSLDEPIVDNESWALEDADTLFQRLLKPSSKYKR